MLRETASRSDMRYTVLACFPLLTSLFLTSSAGAVTLYVSPSGTWTPPYCMTRDTPCTLASAASAAVAGDTVVLTDGVYKESLNVVNSGTSEAWITFQADECSTPIIEGPGVGPNEDVQDNGVGSSTAHYVRFKGIVARGWNIGFGNGWVGGRDTEDVSNGHWEIEHCVSYSNGRTGFTFFSAESFSLKHSISAHNGSSVLHSWSSGVTLLEAMGTGNVVDGNVSFENTDRQNYTDGSGFIVDEQSNDATFINNIAFGNAGSCLRLTRSSGTRFINNTCYHNSQFGSLATGPTNPGEVYFSNGGVTLERVTFMNNVIVGTGESPAGPDPVVNQPSSGWTNNVVTEGQTTVFVDPGGTNPNLVPASSASNLIGQGTSGNGAPTTDIGFDPKCIVKRTPVMVGQVAAEPWWQYDVDIDYIKSIGGVARCFSPKARSGAPDMGAYSAGTVTTSTPGNCTPPVVGMGGMGGATGMGGTGGGPGTGGANPGGTNATGAGGSGAGGAGNAAGAPVSGGTNGTAGSPVGAGGTAPTGQGGAVAAGGTPPATGGTSTGGISAGGISTGGSATASGGSSSNAAGAAGSPDDPGGCGCRLGEQGDPVKSRAVLGLLGLGALGLLRRRRSRG
jgi:MYXO-CTERM domain-containing protein